MSLSRKHYVAVAGILAHAWVDYEETNTTDEWDAGHRYGVENIALDLASYFASDNPNFDRRRFLVAAGVEVSK